MGQVCLLNVLPTLLFAPWKFCPKEKTGLSKTRQTVAATLLNFYHQASLSSASAGRCPYSHSLFEQGLDGMPLHWWALDLNFAFKWLTVDDDENA